MWCKTSAQYDEIPTLFHPCLNSLKRGKQVSDNLKKYYCKIYCQIETLHDTLNFYDSYKHLKKSKSIMGLLINPNNNSRAKQHRKRVKWSKQARPKVWAISLVWCLTLFSFFFKSFREGEGEERWEKKEASQWSPTRSNFQNSSFLFQ